MTKLRFIKSFIWHEVKQEYVLKKVSGYINTFKTESERLAAAHELKKEIQDLLKSAKADQRIMQGVRPRIPVVIRSINLLYPDRAS